MSPKLILSETPAEVEISASSQEAFDKKDAFTVLAGKNEHTVTRDKIARASDGDSDDDSDDVIIITGADAAAHLLLLRDDYNRVLTFRSIMLASGLGCFQAVMNQIYQVSFEFRKPISLPLSLPGELNMRC
jgi:hypothetical protein